MIALARADARRLRAVARRGFPSGRPRGPAPPVRLTADGDRLTLAAHLGEVVVALRTATPRPAAGPVTVPLDALAACEGSSGDATMSAGRRGLVTARWGDGPHPKEATFAPPELAPAWPPEPARLVAVSPHLTRALHETGRCAARDPDSGRYAVSRVQVRGKDGEVIGTDGKQALVWGGFTFPFAEDRLVPAVPLFGSRELVGEAAVSVGLAKEWLYLVIGPWQVWLRVDSEGRFPDVRGAAPRARGTRVTVAEPDAEALLAALPHLPGLAGPGGPVTLEFGPAIALRARDAEGGPAAEVPLPGSAAAGPAGRVVLDRDFLARALLLGFRDLRVSSPERPVVFRDQDRTYLAATLDSSCAVPPSTGTADVIDPPAVPASSPSPSLAPPLPERSNSMAHRNDPSTDRNGQAEPPSVGDPIDPLAEAEALRAALAEAANRSHRLVAALKQYRRERRSLQAAWSSLRQLNLGP